MSEFNVDYFIAKFSAIPDEKWKVGGAKFGDCMCALAHCGEGHWCDMNEERAALIELFGSKGGDSFEAVTDVNDGSDPKTCYFQSERLVEILAHKTPKARILAALNDIKSKQATV